VRPFRLLSILISVIWCVASPAQGAEIERLKAEWNGGQVSVSFELERAFDYEQIRQALQSGLATGFTYHVELIRKRPNWFDSTLDVKTIEVIASLNSVTREYLLNYRRDRRLVRSETLSDFASLQKRMTSIAEEGLLEAGKAAPSKLRVRVRADLLRGYLLYVIPWDVTTSWKEVRVRRQPAEAGTPAAERAQNRPR
jgi:hypothetical protein